MTIQSGGLSDDAVKEIAVALDQQTLNLLMDCHVAGKKN
jgi:hypothetical protein